MVDTDIFTTRREIIRVGGLAALGGVTGCLGSGGGGTTTTTTTTTATATTTAAETATPRVVFEDAFEDSGYADNWEFDPNAHYEETVSQQDGYLLHVTQGVGDLLWTNSAFDASGTRTLRVRMKPRSADYTEYRAGLKFKPLQGSLTLVENAEDDEFRVNRWSGSDDSQSLSNEVLSTANTSTDVRPYELVVDFGEPEVTTVRRGSESYDVGLALPESVLADRFHVEIGAGIDHEVEYHNVTVQGP